MITRRRVDYRDEISSLWNWECSRSSIILCLWQTITCEKVIRSLGNFYGNLRTQEDHYVEDGPLSRGAFYFRPSRELLSNKLTGRPIVQVAFSVQERFCHQSTKYLRIVLGYDRAGWNIFPPKGVPFMCTVRWIWHAPGFLGGSTLR